jgi:predicted RNA-binding protein with RPS1 domain
MPPNHIPPPGAIEPGVICRVEAYGAFCQLTNFRYRGLIHISQLANFKVEQVEDVLSIDDQVWVKVLSVEEDANQQGRFKVSLSLKDASQDGTRQDLGAQRDQQDLVANQIENHLNSSIGMAVARDPMADRLTMKHKGSTFHGYSLVGDDEGEPERAAVVPVVPTPQSETRLAPVGRGRGATLPAWMTKAPDGPTGADSGDDGSEEGSDRRKKRKEKKKKEHKHSKNGRKHRRRHRHDDSEDSEDSYRKRHRKRRSHDREKRSRDKDRKDRKRDCKDGDLSEASGDDNNRGDQKRETGTSGADRNKSSRRRREGSHSREGSGERKRRSDSPDCSGEHRHGRRHRRGRSGSYSNDRNSSSIGRKRSRSRERGKDVKRESLKEKGANPTVL